MWALATMLPEGSKSWSMLLTAGADLLAADARTLQTDPEAGNLRLADAHYGVFAKALPPKGGFASNQQAVDEIADPRIVAGEPPTQALAEEYGYSYVGVWCAANAAFWVALTASTFKEAPANALSKAFHLI